MDIKARPCIAVWLAFSFVKNKKPVSFRIRALISPYSLSHSAGDLTGTEASGADVHVSGGALHDRLHALHVGLPGAVGTAMGVGHLNAEGDALVAEFTLGHFAYLLASKYTQIMEHRQI